MHELSVAQNIIDIVRECLRNDLIYNVDTKAVNKDLETKVKSILIEVGEFRNILPELLEFGFEVLIKGTGLEGAKLNIIHIPLTVKCRDCWHISRIEPAFFFCSKCESNNVDIETGNELQVKEIEIV